MSLERFLKYIKDGEPVTAGVTNRPIQQLDQNIKYLWDIIQAASLGSTVYAREQTIAADLQIGQPVYFNAQTNRFEKAYATTVSNSTTGYLEIPDQAQVWGIVAEKHNATLADILLFGFAQIDIHAAVGSELNQDGSVPAATWYLSSVGAGFLTRQLPPLTIPVCKTTGNGGVFVNPSFVDFLENHRHYAFDLVMTPAGSVSPPVLGNPHVISNPDNTLPGWLPVSDTIFGGLAPDGAVFGYNLSQDPVLANAFPPIPLQSVVVTMQRPSCWDSSITRTSYAQQLESDTIVVDHNGIWWMTNCYDQVPWPTDLDTTSSISASLTTCDPAAKLATLKLYYVRVNAATDNTMVTSLRSLDPRLKVLCNGSPASTGNLELDLDFDLMLGNTTLPGYNVLKTFNPATGVFRSGNVTESIYASSSDVLISSSHSVVVGGVTYHFGTIGIGLLAPESQELSSQLVRLDGVTEESHPVLYLGMPNDRNTGYIVKFEVPTKVPVNSQFSLRLRIIGRAAGTLPPLYVECQLVNRPVDGLLVPADAIQSSEPMIINTVATIGANQVVEAVSNSITVSQGDLVFIRVQRTPADVADQYNGEVGILQQVGVLSSPLS